MFNENNTMQAPGFKRISEDAFTEAQKTQLNEVQDLQDLSEQDLESVAGGAVELVTAAAVTSLVVFSIAYPGMKKKKDGN
jgi:hypothetical protein